MKRGLALCTDTKPIGHFYRFLLNIFGRNKILASVLRRILWYLLNGFLTKYLLEGVIMMFQTIKKGVGSSGKGEKDAMLSRQMRCLIWDNNTYNDYANCENTKNKEVHLQGRRQHCVCPGLWDRRCPGGGSRFLWEICVVDNTKLDDKAKLIIFFFWCFVCRHFHATMKRC